jgi:hypothetical protein
LGNTGINFSGFDADMPQQVLNDANIGTGFEQMGGVGVAQYVQRNGPANARAAGGLFHYLLQAALAVGLARLLAQKGT